MMDRVSVLGTPNEESWPGVKQLPDYKPTFPQWSAQNLAEQVPYLDAAGIDLLKVTPFQKNFFLTPLTVAERGFSLSKHSHTTVPSGSLQNAPWCTRILPITEDNRSSCPPPYVHMCIFSTLSSPLRFFFLRHAFLSPVGIVARICVTFNYPNHRPGITHAIVQ